MKDSVKEGLAIARLRASVGLSQSELARKLNMHRQQFSEIERGLRSLRLTPDQYVTLLDSLDISPWRLLKELEKGSEE
jgi:transcriptional regulator with XRE-family HTH domain